MKTKKAAISMPPYSIITSIAGGYASKYSSKWERYQLAMPVSRMDVVSVQYLYVLIASLVGIPIIAAIVGISVAIHESLSVIAREVFSSTVSTLSLAAGTSLLCGALFFPLTCAKISENKVESLAFVSLIAAIGIIGLVSWAGSSLSLPQYVIPLVCIAASAILFVLSYFLTRKLYAKLDL